jgi:hypothetical protein
MLENIHYQYENGFIHENHWPGSGQLLKNFLSIGGWK